MPPSPGSPSSQSWGRKPVLTAALALATVTMALFAGIAGPA
ncbi:hypothetical protein [Microbacterium sp. 18062]|nr:hypothetical protein [Microbacterium sp. 18062]